MLEIKLLLARLWPRHQLLKARRVQVEQTAYASQGFDKHVPMATTTVGRGVLYAVRFVSDPQYL
jgi:hypothetical protein